jgi:hypothetical protein
MPQDRRRTQALPRRWRFGAKTKSRTAAGPAANARAAYTTALWRQDQGLHGGRYRRRTHALPRRWRSGAKTKSCTHEGERKSALTSVARRKPEAESPETPPTKKQVAT